MFYVREVQRLEIVFDKDVLLEKRYGCSPGMSGEFMKMRTEDIGRNFSSFPNHTLSVSEV